MIDTLSTLNPIPGPGGNPGPPSPMQPDDEIAAAAMALIERAQLEPVRPTADDLFDVPGSTKRPSSRAPVLALLAAAAVVIAIMVVRIGDSTEDGTTDVINQPPPTALSLAPEPTIEGAIETRGPMLTVTEVGIDAFAFAGAGWNPGEAVDLSLCGIDSADCGTFLTATAAADGSFHRRLKVASSLPTADGTVDCRAMSCVASATAASGNGAEAPIAFGRSVAMAPGATMTISQTEGLRAGATITVTGEGWPVSRALRLSQCGQFLACDHLGIVTTDNTGSFSVDVEPVATIDAEFTTTDCSADGCAVVVELVGPTSQVDQLSAAIAFGARTDLDFATVTDDYVASMTPGDVITFIVADATPGDRYEFAQCTDGFYCTDPAVVIADDTGAGRAELPLAQIIATATGPLDCVLDGGCYLTNRHIEQQTPHSWGPVVLTFER